MSSVQTAWPRGIDVSNWQGAIDWDAVAGAGYRFAAAKASEGTYYRDAYFGQNWAGMARTGLVRIAYHFARPDESEPEAEVDWFLQAVDDYGLGPGDLLALDLEVGGGDLAAWAERFQSWTAERLGFRPLLYSSAGFIDAHGLAVPELAGDGLWLAAWRATLPEPPEPWAFIAVWQHTDAASVPGVDGPVDGDQCPIGLEALAAFGAPGAVPPPDVPMYEYDWQEPARLQEQDWDCSCESMEWQLYAWGLAPDDDWIEQSMIAEHVVDPEVGCLDASGAGLAAWANRHCGADGFVASNQTGVSFDAVAAEAGEHTHPIQIGGQAWYHWSGLRGYDVTTDQLLLANPAPGWQAVGQTMSRTQWASLGPWSMVRLTNPAAEGDVPTAPLDYSPWTDGGKVGSGIIELMQADGVLPAQDYSTWLPLGRNPAQIEECIAESGVVYRWLLTTNHGYRYRPD